MASFEEQLQARGFEVVGAGAPADAPAPSEEGQPSFEDELKARGFEVVGGNDNDIGFNTDTAVEFGQGMLGGAVEAAPAFAGMLAGAKGGALAGTAVMPGFGTVAGGLIGGVGGLAAGAYAGGEAREALSNIDMPFMDGDTTLTTKDSDTTASVAGETFGGAIAGGFGTVGLAKAGLRYGTGRVGSFFNEILESAAKRTRTFLMAETAGGAAAAGAGAAAYEATDGNEYVRLGAEISAGALSPTRILAGSFSWMKNSLSQMAAPITAGKVGVKSQAAFILQEYVETFGEDPEMLLRAIKEGAALNDAAFRGLVDDTGEVVSPTLAALSESPAFAAMQKRLMEMNPAFAQRVTERNKASLESLGLIVDAMRQSGDPQMVAEAAKLQKRMLEDLLVGRVKEGQQKAVSEAAKLQGSGASMTDINLRTSAILQESLDEARAIERDLWGRINRTADVQDLDIEMLDEIEALRPDFLPKTERIDGTVQRFFNNIRKRQQIIEANAEAVMRGEEPKAIPEGLTNNANELIKQRGKMLELSREAAGAGKLQLANFYSESAKVAEDIIGQVLGGDEAYDIARRYSRALNDSFTRTFAGRAVASDRTGASRIAPETVLKQAMAGGGEASALKLKQLADATKFLDNQSIVDAAANQELVSGMYDAQEEYLRAIMSRAINPDTEHVKLPELRRALNANREILGERFPELTKQIDEAIQSEKAFDALRTKLKDSQMALDQSAYGKLAKVDSPIDAIATAIGGNKPRTELKKLISFAQNSNDPNVRRGFTSAVLEYARNQAMRADGTFDFKKFRMTLEEPMQADLPSVRQMMEEANLFDDSIVGRIDNMSKIAESIIKSQKVPIMADTKDLSKSSKLVSLLARLVGSSATTKASKAAGLSTSGSGLIQAHAGSQAALDLFERLPIGKAHALLTDAMLNPEVMEMLLKTPKQMKDQVKLLRQMHSYMLSSGYFNLYDEDEEQ